MITLLSAALMLHGSDIPHVHPHEAGVALAITLMLAFVVGLLQVILRRIRPS